MSVIQRTETTGDPNLCIHPSGDSFLYAGVSRIACMNIETLESFHREKEARTNNFRFVAVSPDGRFVASMAKCSRDIELETFHIDLDYFCKQDLLICHSVCPGFRSPGVMSVSRFQCKFSQDGSLIAAASITGHLFVVCRVQLRLHCNIVPGMFGIQSRAIATERSFDFDPKYLHKHLTYGDTEGMLHIIDMTSLSVVNERQVCPESDIQCVSYSPMGNVLAVASSDGQIQMLDPDELLGLYTLDTSLQDPGVAMVPDWSGRLPTFVCLAFSSTGRLLATTSTDGKVRVWQLVPDLSLQQLCRRAILKHVAPCHITRLPVPSPMKALLLQIPLDAS